MEGELKKAGMSESQIEEAINQERLQMISAVKAGTLRFESELDRKGTHELVIDKENDMKKFRLATNIDESTHVIGEAYNFELQAKKQQDAKMDRAHQDLRRLEEADKMAKAEAKRIKKQMKAKEKAEAKKAKAEAK